MSHTRFFSVLCSTILIGSTACSPGAILNIPVNKDSAAQTAVPVTPLVGSSLNANSTGEPFKIQITGNDFSFAPASIQVPQNRPVSFTFENKGQMAHDWVIKGIGSEDLHLNASAGKMASKTITFAQAGTYAIVCTLPGHEEYGMKGQMVVGSGGPMATTLPSQPKMLPTGLTRLPQPEVVPPLNRNTAAVVPVEIETREVTATMADGVVYTYWTFGGTVPGPMVRVRQGDTVELTLKNALKSQLTHSIDLHAVSGTGGGGKDTQIPPGGMAKFRFQALNPGIYVYHCATPKVAHHIANGMYGLIVVEPPEGLPKVDREFYVMQGEFYLKGQRGETGWQESSWNKLLSEQPDYVFFNGAQKAVNLNAIKGETVRFFFGVGGPNITSSFHIIGEIFDKVYPEGAGEALSNVQTTLVPTGGATRVELKLDVPGTYVLVDHSLGRLEKGAAGILNVSGSPSPDIFQPLEKMIPEQAADGHTGAMADSDNH